MNGFSEEPGERRARVASTQPPGRSRPADETMARTARVAVSSTTTPTEDCSPCPAPVWTARASSRACSGASRVETTVGCDGEAARASSPAAAQARSGKTIRRGMGSAAASRAAFGLIRPFSTSLCNTTARARLAAWGRRSGLRSSGAWGMAINSACSALVRVEGSWPK